MCDVRPIRLIKVYSPTRANRERFAAEMTDRVGVEIRPVDSAAEALRDVDIVNLATNARDVLIDWDDLAPGVHVTTLRWPNLATDIFRRADVVVSNARPVGRWQPGPNDYVYLHDYVMGQQDTTTLYGGDPRLDPASPEYVDWQALPDLGDLIAGRGPRRADDRQITVHANNIGIALQFAAAGARLLERARERDVGREIPTEWLLQTVHP
jgi:ornithine cyclodeaminase/alanine dehydrogenase-like protein (mu-crystallin family)